MRDDRHTELVVETYTRPALLLEPVDAKIETLERLESEGTIEELTHHSWPAEVSVSDHGLYDDVEETFREFDRWAATNEVHIRPPFSIRTRRSTFTGETSTVLVTPVMSLAIYLEDQLAAVFPHSDGDVHYPVSEAIAALKTGGLPIRNPVPTDRLSSTESAFTGLCRSCGGSLVNVQGLLTCHDCLESEATDEQPRRPHLAVSGE